MQKLQVLLRALAAEANARVDDEPVTLHAARDGGIDRVAQPRHDGGVHPVAVAVLLLVVHEHEMRSGRRGDRIRGPRVASRRPHVVHHGCAGLERRGGHHALAGVDADPRPVTELGCERAHDGDGQRQLGAGVDRGVVAVRTPRAGRLGADVEDVGARLHHRAAQRHGGRHDIGLVAPVGRQPVARERVGRDVDDAHQVRPLAPAQLGCHHSSSGSGTIMPRTAPTR